MYQYDNYDQALVNERVAQFSDQVRRRLSGELSEEEFLPLRLQNGLYLQRHAYMLRVAIPYGHLSSQQLRVLAKIARDYDRDYGHISTRQNMQFNWVELEKIPEILALLASVQMHAIQTSGNCIRNITSDQFAGVAADEILDTRVLAEILRQWSTIHPEFAFLPRKFKIAISGAEQDRALVQAHDIGLQLFRSPEGKIQVRVLVGGGLGRTPIIGSVIKEDLPWQDLVSYLESIIRVYNRHGRRDNKYKARIKILVKALGIEKFAQEVDEEWAFSKTSIPAITEAEFQRVAQYFAPPEYAVLADDDHDFEEKLQQDSVFKKWVSRSVVKHRVPGYASVTLSTKPGISSPPGDLTSHQMDLIADWAERFGFGELRFAHEQNVVLPDVRKSQLYELWMAAKDANLATANVGLLTDMIACPGGDFCSLANAKSIPIAQAIQERFSDLDYVHDLGDLSINISGCINACGHHHVGNIGILGVDKDGKEWYQVTLGGSQGNATSLGKVIGPSFDAEQMPDVISEVVNTYVDERIEGETFIETFNRIGMAPFKTRLYPEGQ